MILLTPELHAALRVNAAAHREATQSGTHEPDPAPVVKFFNPVGAATWLATELYDDGDTLFGLADLTVKRVLALGNLLPAIRDLYRKEQIDAATVRHLTMASKSQQKAWLALADDENAYLPTGHQLKSWLFGGQSIPVKHALFDVEASGLATIADLFGEDRYVADPDAFWTAQNA